MAGGATYHNSQLGDTRSRGGSRSDNKEGNGQIYPANIRENNETWGFNHQTWGFVVQILLLAGFMAIITIVNGCQS